MTLDLAGTSDPPAHDGLVRQLLWAAEVFGPTVIAQQMAPPPTDVLAECVRAGPEGRRDLPIAWESVSYRESATLDPMRHLHLTHPRLDVWVTVEIWERDGHHMATADLGEDSREIGVGDTPQDAVRVALRSLGEPYASEIAEGIDVR